MDLVDLNARVLPHQVRYSNITPLSMESESKTTKFFPVNGGAFNNFSNNIVKIAVNSQNSFLDGQMSFIKLDITNTSGQSARLQSSGHSIFKNIRIQNKMGGADLEYLRYYDQLHCALSDLALDPHSRFTRRYEGYGDAGVFRASINAQPALTRAQLATALGLVEGQPVGAVVAGNGIVAQNALGADNAGGLGTNETLIANNTTITLCLPLLSCLVGTSAEKYLPLFLTGEIGLEFEFNDQALVGDVAGDGHFTIQNIAFHSQLITFSNEVNMALNSMCLQTGIFMNGTSWKTQSIPVAGGSQNVLISDKFKSIKSLLFSFSKPRGDNTGRSLARFHNNITQYRVKAGSKYYPNGTAVAGTASDMGLNSEFIVELFKASGDFSNIHHTSIINNENFALESKTTTSVGRSLYGLDLDAFCKSKVESGLNSYVNSPMYIDYTATGADASSMFVHLNYDVLFCIKPDGTFVSSS